MQAVIRREDFAFLSKGRVVSELAETEKGLLQTVRRLGPKKNRAILLLHGFTSSPAVYRELIPRLKQYDAVVCPLLPGHGSSFAAFSKVRAEEWRTTVEEEACRLLAEYQEVDLLGLSLGGLLAYSLSQKYPFRHLYLLAPALRIPHQSVYRYLAKILQACGLQRLYNRAGSLQSTRFAELAYRYVPLSAITEILGLVAEFRYQPPSCPTELFLGAYDRVIDTAKVKALFADEALVRMHWLERSNHVLPLDVDLEYIAAIIESTS